MAKRQLPPCVDEVPTELVEVPRKRQRQEQQQVAHKGPVAETADPDTPSSSSSSQDEPHASADAGHDTLLRLVARRAAPLRRGLAFVWLHFVYEPYVYRRRVRDAHRFLSRRQSTETTLGVEEAVQVAARAPFHARLPADARGFLEPVAALRRPADEEVLYQALPGRRSALRAALEARRAELLSTLAGPFATCRSRLNPERRHYFGRVPLEVCREGIFDSSVEALLAATPAQLLAGLHVRFLSADGVAEAGVDSGGLSREFFDLALRELVADGASPAVSAAAAGGPRGHSLRRKATVVEGRGQPMFREQADKALMLVPSMRPLAVYHALGRLLAAALVHASYGDAALPLPLNDCLLKYLVGQPITAADVRRRDPLYYKNRIEALLRPGGIEDTAAALLVDQLVFEEDGVELLPGGARRPVTPQNVEEYVRLLCEEYVCGAVRSELAAVLAGFHDVVPQALLQACGLTFAGLGVLLAGAPQLDVAAWRRHAAVRAAGVAEYAARLAAARLWQTLEGWPQEDLSVLLAFVTGCSRLPAVGFGRLDPAFTVEVVPCLGAGQLPTAHTCFNCLTLPAYPSLEILADKLSTAAHEGACDFSLR